MSTDTTTTTTTTASDVTMKRIFVGNLGNNVTTDDLVQLFGLSKSDFLKKTCSLELVIILITVRSQEFTRSYMLA